MSSSFEERKEKYIESVMTELVPEEQDYWRPPSATYHYTAEFAARSPVKVNTNEAVHIRKTQKDWLIAAVMMLVTFLLLYLVWQSSLSWMLFLFLIVMLLIILPGLLDNKTMIRISKEGIWLHALQKEVQWDNVVLALIKEVLVEQPFYYFILHYYDERKDDFARIEIALDGLVSPADLSATVEAFRK